MVIDPSFGLVRHIHFVPTFLEPHRSPSPVHIIRPSVNAVSGAAYVCPPFTMVLHPLKLPSDVRLSM